MDVGLKNCIIVSNVEIGRLRDMKSRLDERETERE